MELQFSELDVRTREHYRHADGANRNGWRRPTQVRLELRTTLATLLADVRPRFSTRKALSRDFGMAISLDAPMPGDATLEPTH